MSGQNFIVPPKSWDAIENTAYDFRSFLGLADIPYFPVIDVMEKVLDHKLGVTLEVCSLQEMGPAEGYASPQGDFIRLREDVYRNALKGRGRDRFTACHEIGHLLLHANQPLSRVVNENFVPPFRLSEPQANHFAACLLIPKSFVDPLADEEDLSTEHGTSIRAARLRIEYVRRKGWAA